jgi:hypothetical protein
VIESVDVKFQGSVLGFLSFLFCLRCTPDLDKLSASFGHAGAGGHAGLAGAGASQGGAGSGGAGSGGTGEPGGSPDNGEGGTTAGASEGGEAGSIETGQGGSNEGGEAGAVAAGEGGKGGKGGGAGHGGTTAAGGTTSMAGTTSAGSGGAMAGAGAGGAAPVGPCEDGCALLYIPPTPNFAQFFTINLDLSSGFDLSDSVFTARVRAIDYTGSGDIIQFYASSTGYAFFGGTTNATVASLVNGGTLTMDLTSTPGWDSTHTISFGFLLHGSATPTTVQILVEDITVTVKADPTATPKVGPWLFTQPTDVNDAAAETISTTYSDQNIIFANPYMPAMGSKAIWEPPNP